MLTLEDHNALSISNLSEYFSKSTSMRLLFAKLDQHFYWNYFQAKLNEMSV